jgi:glycosyltransferase involved in cell wall biosynthesis
MLLTGSNVIGGMERVALSLARSFQARGWDVRAVFAPGPGSDSLLRWARDQGVDAEAHRGVRDYMAKRRISDLFALRALVGGWRPDVVNMHFPGGHISLKEAAAVRAAGRFRLVVNAHLPVPWSESGRQKRRMTRLAAMLSDHLVAHSGAMARVMYEAGVPASRVRVIPNGVEPPRGLPARAEARARLRLPAGAPTVATLARLAPVKGVGHLVEAVARIPAGDGAPVLAVGGDGPERAALEALAADRLGDRAIFLGAVVGDPSDVYAAADVFTLPSLLEGFPMVLLEAMMRGTAVVATDVGGVAEMMEDGVHGLLVPPGDPDALSRAVARLLADPELRRELGDAARARALVEFSEERMADRYEEVFAR